MGENTKDLGLTGSKMDSGSWSGLRGTGMWESGAMIGAQVRAK